MVENKDPKNSEVQNPAGTQGNVHIDGNVVDSNIIIGNNNVIIIGGKQVAFHTGWFYGHRYGDLATFTGRVDELKMLDTWLANKDEALLMLRALGGFGKSALAWTWFNRVDREQWQTAVWWSFYEKESGFESFLSETLKHLGVEVKQSTRQQVNDLLEALRGTNILIVLDGFERLLRQYGRMDAALQSDDEDADIDPSQRDCSSPLTETFLRGLSGAGMKSKVLMTTRLCPRALESADGKLLKGCRDEALSAFSPDDAVTYFHNEGVKATRAEIAAVCSAYGYHPLSLSLLVGLINENHEKRGDIAAVKNLEIFENVKARRHHVLERAYESLALERRDLLSKISCFRGSMEYAVLKKVFPSPDLDKALLDLRKRGLLQYTGETQRYDMHPIVRHYAYDRMTTVKRKNVHKRLTNYFATVELPKQILTIDDLMPVMEHYHHMAKAGETKESYELYRDKLANVLFFHFAAYQIIGELLSLFFSYSESKFQDLSSDSKAFILNWLANVYTLNGQPQLAVSPYIDSIALLEKQNNKIDTAVVLTNFAATTLIQIGKLRKTEENLRRSIILCGETMNEFPEAVAYLELGRVLSYLGEWDEAGKALSYSHAIFDRYGVSTTNFVSVVRAYKALLLIFLGEFEVAIETTKEAFALAAESYNGKLDIMRAYYLLGTLYRLSNNLNEADENLLRAINICRQSNVVSEESNILLELAKLRYAQGDFKDAQEKASEALMITERSGYVLQGADVNLFLAQYALEQEKDKVKAKEYAEEAKKLATCDGPPYYYKVAYEEAERMLEKLKV
jgi:tetratricopeptide (TPR) repeat protein